MMEASSWSAGGAPRCAADVVSTLTQVPKRLLAGRPLYSSMMGETLLPKKLALPVLCSEPLSAYASEEILLMLSLGALAAAPRAWGRAGISSSGTVPSVRLQVIDQGPGIPPSQWDKILSPSSVWVTTMPRQASACWRS